MDTSTSSTQHDPRSGLPPVGTDRASVHRRRRSLRVLAALLAAVAMLAAFGADGASAHSRQPDRRPNPPAPAPSPPTVVVSLSWDDGRASQTGSLALQARYGFPATYYVNSGRIGTSNYYLNKWELDLTAYLGNEIGGHTERHENLTTQSPADAKAAVCADRQRLVNWYGKRAGKSFAYPFGAINPSVQEVVRSCGYQSGRGVGGLRGTESCFSCPFAETIPSFDPYWLASVSSVTRTTTLASLQQRVLQAESVGGGWLVYVLHDLGVDPSDPSADNYSIDPALYNQFLAWLSKRPNVKVKTVADAMAGPAAPAAPDPATNLLLNSDLETDADANGVADCWQRSGFGTNTFSWARVGDAHSGAAAEQVTITQRTDGDRKLVVTQQDDGTCSPDVAGGESYALSAWYKSTAPSAVVAYYRDSGGVWKYWITGRTLPATDTWTQTVFRPGPLPPDATALSFGVALVDVGVLAVDDLMMTPVPVGPPTTLPTTPEASCSGVRLWQDPILWFVCNA